MLRRCCIGVGVVLALAIGCGPTPPTWESGGVVFDGPSVRLDAGGATFVQPIMKFWTDEFRALTDDKVKINYQGTGSSDGVKRLTSKEFAFGCSDAPMSKAEWEAALAKGGEVVHIPLVVGAVVVTYHLDSDRPVTFSGQLLADIFLGRVKRWDDPAVAALNPGLPLPALEIQPVFRSEGSGTSYIFSEYLSKSSAEFRTKVGATKAFPDAVGVGKKGSDGVAGHIAATPGAIGYVELTYALDTKARYGRIINRAGKPVEPTLDSITAAAAMGMSLRQTAAPYSLHDLTYNLTDMPGDDSYPIAATSFCLLYKKQKPDRGQAIVTFLRWATSAEGQSHAERRNFARLPAELREKIAEKLSTIEFGQ